MSADIRAGFRAALQAARRHTAQAGAETVLDQLLRGSWRDVLPALLRETGGMDMVDGDSGQRAVPDPTLFGAPGLALARSLRAVPVRLDGEPGRLRLAMADPWDDATLRRAAQAMGRRVPPIAATAAQLDGWLGSAPSASSDASSSVSAVGSSTGGALPEGPVVAFVDQALRRAYEVGASDIHFECDRHGVTVRLRRDGVLTPHERMEGSRQAEEAISRIKVLAQLDITERRLPQDGRFRIALGGGELDLRVSIIPSVFGEDAVLRLLDKAQLRDPADQVSLDLLGFDASGAAMIRELAGLPHGMLLVTGPTGSGKTTTVYAALSEVNNGIEKIITIEDPVEYELAGVLQVPVNERKGLTFAKGLRSILRHDPDRILVGEIRDAETAEIAVQSALTGHQVLTTVHANSVFDVTGRFKHFDLDMFGFMAALNGVIVQRLVRCLCPHCVADRPATAREQQWLVDMGLPRPETVPRPVGCERCGGTGYKGRRVIAEVHTIDDGFRDLVTTGAPVSALREHVYRKGVRTLSQLGADMVSRRESSAEEIKRVVGW
ncbi:GspE/PulE family protein [Mitsuaria sp. BK037]|uniref:GspE/PulE family protein n=1 Tax=Mitsuaria sp. BK037 TaxID=2587122 RepID=UPI0018201834|nr:GspE/PulE family protein [Mitsuaria sp. BK037]MBB3284589.1 general secretion pathway protein E [Mitsuaria sp. BK037]